MTQEIQHIANQVATEYNRKPNDLKKKRYSPKSNIKAMKEQFVSQCLSKGFDTKEIADYLDHNCDSIYRIMPEKPKRKYEKVLDILQEQGKIHRERFVHLKDTITLLRKKGHHIYCEQGVYYLADTAS